MTKIKITKEELEDLYWNLELSTRDIAKKLGVGQTTVRRWLAKHNIKTRSTKESMKTTVFLDKLKILAERYKTEYTQDIIKFCEYCGNEFHVDGSHKKIKYCSKECSRASVSLKLKKDPSEKLYTNVYTCELCGGLFSFEHPRKYIRRFCDDCLSKHKSDIFTNKVKTTCGYCGKELEVIPSRFYSNKYCYCDKKMYG